MRPKFEALRLVSAKLDNSKARRHRASWKFEVSKKIDIGVAYSSGNAMPILAVLNITFSASGVQSDDEGATANFEATYEAIFKFDSSATAEEVDAAMEKDDGLNYLLSAQAATLASYNFRSIVQQCGFDPKMVPLAL